MAGFLYFKPMQSTPITREQLVAWGLGYAFPQQVNATQCNANNPTGMPGFVFADPDTMGEWGVKMAAEAQAWRKLPQSDVWVGYWKAAKPTPADLARKPMLPGSTVKLGDGHEWQIPLVRRFDIPTRTTISNLPTYMDVDDNGNWHRGSVLEIHAHLWDVTAPIADALLNEYLDNRPPEVKDDEITTALVALLAANYRVGKGELAHMRAFTNEGGTHAACMCACDWPTFIAWNADQTGDGDQKKSDSQPPAAGSSTSVGAAA